MMPLNRKEQRIFDYIKKTIAQKGYAPSVRDICAALDYKSTSTVHMYLARLESLGYITKEDGKSRTLRVGDDSDELRVSRIPMLGRVTAGQPILAVENPEGYVGFVYEGTGFNTEEMFALRVSGTSMINAGILDGDIVFVEKCSYADNGTIVVALVGDEATVKRFYRENGGYRLQPENPDMNPILVSEDDDVSIIGRVVAVSRLYQ